jgi:hypothetical protein
MLLGSLSNEGSIERLCQCLTEASDKIHDTVEQMFE